MFVDLKITGLLNAYTTQNNLQIQCNSYPNTRDIFPKIRTNNPCVCVCVCLLVAQSSPTLCDPMEFSPPGSSVPVFLQARIQVVGIMSPN